MKVLIVYDTHHGFTEKCAGLLAGELPPGADLWPLHDRPGTPDWGLYDAVIVGGPVYFGRWSPRLVAFLNHHASALIRPSLALGAFVVSLSPRAAALKYFAQGVPVAFKGRWGHVSCFGGGFTWKHLAWWERWLLKKTRRIETDASNLSLPEIQSLATWLTGLPSAKGIDP